MKNFRSLNWSFVAGQISENMLGRIDDADFQMGAKKLLNFISSVEGTVYNRNGTKYRTPTKYNNRKSTFLPFIFSSTQAYALEFGHEYIRVHTISDIVLNTGASAWNSATNYVIGDLVVQSSITYYCIQDNVNKDPSVETAYWYAQPSIYLEIPTPYQEEDLFKLRITQNYDILTITYKNYPSYILYRFGTFPNFNWGFKQESFSPTIEKPLGPSLTSVAPNRINISAVSINNPCEITTVSDHLLSEGELIHIQEVGGTVGTILNDFWLVDKTSAGNKLNVKSYETGVVFDSTAFGYTSGGYIEYTSTRNQTTNCYKVAAVSSNGIEESIPSNILRCSTNNLFAQDAYNEFSWLAVTGAQSYNVYKSIDGGLYAYIGNTEQTSFIDNNIAPEFSKTPRILDTVLETSNYYPNCATYYQQRKVYGGSINEPQTIRMTVTGSQNDMSYSLPIKDTDRISFQIAALELSEIRHLVPLTTLIALTNSNVWAISAGTSGVLTPSSIFADTQSNVGCSDVSPVNIDANIVFANDRGGRLTELKFNWNNQSFTPNDLTIKSFDLFVNKQIVDLDYMVAPEKVIWAVSSDGKLLGCTYVPEQNVRGWHQHETINGSFESCCIIPDPAGSDKDWIFLVVKRVIEGQTVRYVETLQIDRFQDLENSYYVDCGIIVDNNNVSNSITITGGINWDSSEPLTLTASSNIFTYPGSSDVDNFFTIEYETVVYTLTVRSVSSATSAIVQTDKTLPEALRATSLSSWGYAKDVVTGLDHLNGQTVSVLGDGAVQNQKVVSSGSITLDVPAVKVIVGLPITSDLRTLPFAKQVDSAYGQGLSKNINKVWIRTIRSSSLFVGPSFDKLMQVKQRTTEPYGSPPDLMTGVYDIVITPSWNMSGELCVRQNNPLPLHISMITMDVAFGDS